MVGAVNQKTWDGFSWQYVAVQLGCRTCRLGRYQLALMHPKEGAGAGSPPDAAPGKFPDNSVLERCKCYSAFDRGDILC